MSKPEPWLHIRAAGTPIPQGSKRAWINKQTGKVQMVEDQGDRHASWRSAVTAAATEALWRAGTTEPTTRAVSVLLTFLLMRGVGMYGSGRNATAVKASSPSYPVKPPDLDKLVRAVFDSLTDARVWVDDSQVVAFTARKRFIDRYGEEPPGVDIVVGFLPEEHHDHAA
jgi:Holliday junction resolvase RusA-like endonuclease